MTEHFCERNPDRGVSLVLWLFNNLEKSAFGLDEGALGIGMGIAYTPKAGRDEIFELFQLVGLRRVPVLVHIRNSGPVEPGATPAPADSTSQPSLTPTPQP